MKTHKFARAAVTFLSSAMLMLSPLTVLADTTNDTSVVNSGDHVDVDSNATQNTTVSVTNTNVADITQLVKADANSGDNTANRNIGGGTVNTGAANVGVTMNASANENLTAISGLSTGNTNNTNVVNTGDHLDVDTNTNTNTSVNVSNTNVADVNQLVFGHSNSGDNTANRNIGGGTVNTGAANVGATLNTDVNHNATLVAGFGGVDSLANNTSVVNTGDHADVDTNANSNTSVNVSNFNEACITQLLYGASNSGNNHANRNIGGGTVNTGAANVGATLNASANSNLTGIGLGLGFGSALSNNVFDTVNTGDHLDASANLNSNVTVSADNTNLLSLHQLSFSHSTSGYNHTNRNIGGGTVITGTSNAGMTFNASGNLNGTFFGGLSGLMLGFLGFI